MATSLYDLSVRSYLQILDGLSGILEKGSAHCAEAGTDQNALLEARLADDMLPLTFQLHMANTHSLGTIESLRAGVFSPGRGMPELDFAGYQAHITNTAETLRQVDAAELNSLAGKPMVFRMGEIEMPFTAENFVMSFSLPNFYFHTTAAYAILRTEGVALGKLDYLGQMLMES
jgi:hypothetical protein